MITGGAGFVGSHLADHLLEQGYEVRALDSLCQQVHGSRIVRPEHLSPDVELFAGDIRDPDAVAQALDGMEAVVHLAASVGVGQSMYEITDYTSVNTCGTAVLLEALARKPVSKLVVGSSMSVYGEGLYRTVRGQEMQGFERSLAQLKAHEWDLKSPDNEPLIPVATPESKHPAVSSVYAISKVYQERICLAVGKAYGIPTVALRLFNVYGPRQCLSNPYAGVLAIFAARLLNDKPPLLYEDGEQLRDFVSVHDVAESFRLALETPAAEGRVFNIGTGIGLSVKEAAEGLADALNKSEIEPEIEGSYRMGDVRHCFADISLAKQVLHYEPSVTFEEGLLELAEWVEGRKPVDRHPEAWAELAVRGLTVR